MKNYCHAQGNPEQTIGSSWCVSGFDVSPPSGSTGMYNFMYDLWTQNMDDEIMVFEQYTTPTGGWGQPIAYNVTIGNTTFSEVWQVNNGWNILMFYPKNKRTSGQEDLGAIMNWCRTKGLLSNNVFHELSFGVEVTSSYGWQQYTVNSFWASWGANSSGSGSSSGGSVANGTYKLINRNSGKAMDAYARGTANGTQIIQWSYGGGSNQKWTLTDRGNGQYSIIGVQSGKSLDIAGKSTADGAKVQLYDYWGGSNQKFTFTSEGSGYYRISPTHASDKCLDVNGRSTANGATVIQWSYVGGSNQQWALQSP